ncbi:galactose ABC transporter substrate-binding protein [Eubacteriales bacterium OttesenSCG-928-K08]|nr:galactose ABC transporter substrate-binding protein [Eubacteriales bacterium OttesenSCG-928-K08]
MKKRRGYVYLAIALTLLAIVAAFIFRGSEEQQEIGTVKFGIATYREDDTFISNMMGSLTEIASSYEEEFGVRLNLGIVHAQNSQSTQNDQIARFISLGYDVLCVNLVDRTNALYIIDRAMEANIPVVFFNREPVQEDLGKWDRLYYVGTDASENGRLEGQIIADAYHRDPGSIDKNGDGIIQYIMIEGEVRHQDAVLRTEGSVQAIRDAGIAVEKLDGGIASWERHTAAALAEQYFEKYGDQIEVVICNNDDMALGVIDMVERLELDFSNIVGIDGTPAGREAIRDGKMLGTVVIDYEAQAQLIFDIAYALATGVDPHEVADVREDQSARAPMYVITAQDYN